MTQSRKNTLIWNAKPGIGLDQSPDQAGGEKAVIEPLIGGEDGELLRLFRRIAKGLEAERLGPEKHLQNEKIDMQHSDQRDQNIGDP